MINLLKTDLMRVIKDKLLLIVTLIGVGFAIFTVFLYKILAVTAGAMPELLDMLAINAKTMFFSSFSLSNNYGLILPIFVAIIMCKDYSYGTMRNKIICGHSRTSIFISSFLTATVTMCAVIVIHAFLTLLLALLFFDYQAAPFDSSAFFYFVESFLLEILVYIFASALISFLCVWIKKSGVAIVAYAGIMLLFSLLGGIIDIFASISSFNEETLKVIEFVSNMNIFYSSAYIGLGTSYDASMLVPQLISLVGGTALLVFLGILVFRRKDIK